MFGEIVVLFRDRDIGGMAINSVEDDHEHGFSEPAFILGRATSTAVVPDTNTIGSDGAVLAARAVVRERNVSESGCCCRPSCC